MTDRRNDGDAGPVSGAVSVEAELVRFLDELCDGGCIADRTATIARITALMMRPGIGQALRQRAMDAVGKLARRFEHEAPCVNGLAVMKKRVPGGER